MKRISIILSLAVLTLGGCSKSPASKEEQLAELKKQKTETDQKIATLESELKASGKMATGPERVEQVSVMPVKTETFRHYLEVQGKVDADENVSVSPKVPGVLTSIRVQRGDRVSKGQVIATLDDAAVSQGLEEIKTQIDLANTVYDKQKRLWDQKIGTEVQYLQAKTNKESLQRRLRSLQAQVDMYKLKAPITGTVDEVRPKVGEAASPGNPMSVIRIVNFDKTKLVADISESYAAKVKKGDQVLVVLPDTKEEFKTIVTEVQQAIDPTNRTFTIEMAMPKGITSRPNMVALVKINDYTKQNALSLPADLVQQDEKGAFVYVAAKENNKYVARKKALKTGQSYGGQIEVQSGLGTEDLVINSGYQTLNEGTLVKFEQAVAQK